MPLIGINPTKLVTAVDEDIMSYLLLHMFMPGN